MPRVVLSRPFFLNCFKGNQKDEFPNFWVDSNNTKTRNEGHRQYRKHSLTQFCIFHCFIINKLTKEKIETQNVWVMYFNLYFYVLDKQSCTNLMCLKFELTNQDLEGVKNFKRMLASERALKSGNRFITTKAISDSKKLNI